MQGENERLKIDLENEKNWGKIQTKQAEKDTAKEILKIAVDFYNGKDIDGDLFLGTLRERYGVEVE